MMVTGTATLVLGFHNIDLFTNHMLWASRMELNLMEEVHGRGTTVETDIFGGHVTLADSYRRGIILSAFGVATLFLGSMGFGYTLWYSRRME